MYSKRQMSASEVSAQKHDCFEDKVGETIGGPKPGGWMGICILAVVALKRLTN